jgi:hypothetical protein
MGKRWKDCKNREITVKSMTDRAVDPNSLNPDPDTNPDPIWIQGLDGQKLKKKIQLNDMVDYIPQTKTK